MPMDKDQIDEWSPFPGSRSNRFHILKASLHLHNPGDSTVNLKLVGAENCTQNCKMPSRMKYEILNSESHDSLFGHVEKIQSLARSASTNDTVQPHKYDESALTLTRSQSKIADHPSMSSKRCCKVSYIAPSDRIGAEYSPSALTLTASLMSQISKLPSQEKTRCIPASLISAPFVTKSQPLLKRVSSDFTISNTPEIKAANIIEFPVVDDDTAETRSQIRINRMPAQQFRVPTSAKVREKVMNCRGIHAHKKSQTKAVEAKQNCSASEELQAHHSAVLSYWTEVEKRMDIGVLTAAGPMSRQPVLRMSSEIAESIAARLALGSKMYDINEKINRIFSNVQQGYVMSISRATLDYDLLNKMENYNENIDVKSLKMSQGWFYTNICRSHEWQIMRITNIPAHTTILGVRTMEHKLCIANVMMLDLEMLWHIGTFPENSSNFSNEIFSKVLFTNIHDQKFQKELPFSMEKFSAHVEFYAESLNTALRESWLKEAAKIVDRYSLGIAVDSVESSRLVDTSRLLKNAGSETNSNTFRNELDQYFDSKFPNHILNDASLANGRSNSYISTLTNSQHTNLSNMDEKEKYYKNRSQSSLLESNMICSRDNSCSSMNYSRTNRNSLEETLKEDEKKKISVQDKLDRVLNAVSMLMSRHIIGSVEESLRSFVSFFTSRDDSSTTSNCSAILLNLKLNKVLTNSPTDVTLLEKDSVSPQAVMEFEPSYEKLQECINACIEKIVLAGQNFERVDSLLKSHNLGNRSKLLGPSTIGFGDLIVFEAKNCVKEVLKEKLKPVEELLLSFQKYICFFDGTENCKLENRLKQRVHIGPGLIESLEALSLYAEYLCRIEEEIMEVVPDVVEFPLFSTNSREAKKALAQMSNQLRKLIYEAISEDNRFHMNDLCARYQNLVNVLLKCPENSMELKALKEFAIQSSNVCEEFVEEYEAQIYQRVIFLLRHDYYFSAEDIVLLNTTFSWPSILKGYLSKSFELQKARKSDMEIVLNGEQSRLQRDINMISRKLEKLSEVGSLEPEDVSACAKRFDMLKESLEKVLSEAQYIAKEEELLEATPSDLILEVERAIHHHTPLAGMWEEAKTFQVNQNIWLESPICGINAEAIEKQLEEQIFNINSIEKFMKEAGESRTIALEVATTFKNEVSKFLTKEVPFMLLICTPGLRERHWKSIKKITGTLIPFSAKIPLKELLAEGMQNLSSELEEICVCASKEYALEQGIQHMETEWNSVVFEVKPYRKTGTYILSAIDDIQQLLDDQIVKTQAMRSSRYIGGLLDRVVQWENTLMQLQEVLDTWLKVQSTWLYLEPIFTSEDIMRQMPLEGRLFDIVDDMWRDCMKLTFSNPIVMSVSNDTSLLEMLLEANAKLETILKGLNQYLETKRVAFPRFFFLSNDELLEILAKTKDPVLVQPFLQKFFDGIASLEFQKNLDITACLDPGLEMVPFSYSDIDHNIINPTNFGGNVERWLVEVEIVMKKSLAHTIDQSLLDYSQTARIDWIKKWQGQVMLVVNQLCWTGEIEKILKNSMNKDFELEEYCEKLKFELLDTVKLVRQQIPKGLRTALGAIVVMDVHNRDVTLELCKNKVNEVTDFDWLAQLRYYWRSHCPKSSKTGEPGTISCVMINAVQLYAYEYLGNNGRLVITPLTDRCYRTLMGAIHLNLGGAPEGPAGTGKTETTKDLAKAIAIQCVVTNCSDGLDYFAMGKFLKGLASTGAWACFDEFNRIQLEVLSVVAQQILCIQQAKTRGLKRFTFEGSKLALVHTCCPFITMNPGYAGRAELPDNLKVLFRTVAMMVPDYAMISEIILYSYGYADAKRLAMKMVTTYKLCSEQLSNQSHYDNGMRAVMAVLRAAGNLKQSNQELSEDILVLQAIMEVNLPKFLWFDVPLFKGILSDLFPNVTVPDPNRIAMKTAFLTVCSKMNLQATEYFWEKVVQIYDMMVVRHGFMVVGLPFSGKTMAWKVLSKILILLHSQYPDDTRWTNVLYFVINPKAVTMNNLYGQFHSVSREWADGILAIQYRNLAQNKVCSMEDKKLLIFDGPVDAVWIENMNTVLDDNKKLCLMSGEIIAMGENMSIMFETMDLVAASPATVSRCGMIYLEPEKLGWKPLLHSWLARFSEEACTSVDYKANQSELENSNFSLSLVEQQHIEGLFDWYVEPCLAFLRRELKEMVPTVDSNLVMSLMNIMESLLKQSLVNSTEHHCHRRESLVGRRRSIEQITEDKDESLALSKVQMKLRQQDIECIFVFAMLWSLGSSGDELSQNKWLQFFNQVVNDHAGIEKDYPGVCNSLKLRGWSTPNFNKALLVPLPEGGFHDLRSYTYDTRLHQWRKWSDMLQHKEIPLTATVSEIVVPTVGMCQHENMLKLLLSNNKNVLICGPTGTGKSVYANNLLTQGLSQEKFKSIMLGFSARTSATMTQEIIDGKLDKRRKGVYGPPVGQKAIVHVDDLNMPEVETYGAQPPIELLRQLVDSGGWYNLKEMTWQTITETTVLGSMGPPGGGRNPITPRFLRHFNLLCFMEFDDSTITTIFSTMVQWYFRVHESGLLASVYELGGGLVECTKKLFRSISKSLLPTPAKSHYTFNLRDISRLIQGVLMVKPNSEEFDGSTMTRLWIHESLRVFGDRLINDFDRDWLVKEISILLPLHFNITIDIAVDHLIGENTERIVNYSTLRGLFFGDYMDQGGARDKVYQEVKNVSQLCGRMGDVLSEYNATSRKPVNIVMFTFAVEHISRLARILRMPGGNALLIGVGGSGRSSCARLAVHITQQILFQIELSKSYGYVDWQEDLKSVLKMAGTGDVAVSFLFCDSQIKSESYLEDLSNILNSGDVPNLFLSDDRAAMCELVCAHAKRTFGGKRAGEMNPLELWKFFISRVQKNLHVILALSPVGSSFRERVRKFPSIVNCCSIDWFTSWPADALMAVANKFLKDVDIESDSIRNAVVSVCQSFHMDAFKLSDEFDHQVRRKNYVTPTSYLELISTFKTSLKQKREEISNAKKRYEIGLDKLKFATESVNAMQKDLEALKPVLTASQKDTEKLMSKLHDQLPGVEEKRLLVQNETAAAQKDADDCKKQKNAVEAELAEALPALDTAIKSLDTIKQSEINEVKILAKPPQGVKIVCEAVCVMLGIKPQRIPDPDDNSRRIMDFWGPSQRMLGDPDFINQLKNYDKDNISAKIMVEIRKTYMPDPRFTPDAAEKASKAAAGLCKWVYAMETYEKIAKEVAPKQEALKLAESALEVTRMNLNARQLELQKVEAGLEDLQMQYDGAVAKKTELELQVQNTNAKLDRATTLIGGLGGERTRWSQLADNLVQKYKFLVGDLLVSSGVMAYLGPFTTSFRTTQQANWLKKCQNEGILCSKNMSLATTLGDLIRIREWNIAGLPTDAFSIDNAIIIFTSRRWPLIIDPQGQANKWIKNLEQSSKLSILKLTDNEYMRTFENAIQFGYPVILEDLGEELDPALEPLLMKQVFKQGGVNCIRLGDSTIEYSDQFRFYMTTKLRNPHYMPEVSVKVALINFMITPEGLQDQFLGLTVQKERPDLEEQRDFLIRESATNKKKLKEIENQILCILSSNEGNILENQTAIETLSNSKALSDGIHEKQAIAELTEKDINDVRKQYKSIANTAQKLFFCIADLVNIQSVYQYSLTWFIGLFCTSIANSTKSTDISTRLFNLREHFCFALYSTICRSLLEKDKLLFSFMLCTRLNEESINKYEWNFLLTGGAGVCGSDTLDHKNPCSAWLPDKEWELICKLANLPIEDCQCIRDTFGDYADWWKGLYDSLSPEQYIQTSTHLSLEGIRPITVLRCLRPDKVANAIELYVKKYIGELYINPPAFDLNACYAESNCITPLIFILSPGTDPMSAVLRAAQANSIEVKYISLGQGQGSIATEMIAKASIEGSWVVLQNCHLYPSWMSTLEKVVEKFHQDSTHHRFRLWCTTYPSDVFPSSILQSGVKMTLEAPKGLRANLLRSYSSDPINDSGFFSTCNNNSRGIHFRRLLFGLCFFHGVVQERRLYGPIGWNIPYEFNDSDLSISARQIAMFMAESEIDGALPLKALKYTTGECNYGGRVTDDKDRRTLQTLLEKVYCHEALESGAWLSSCGTYFMPDDVTGMQSSYTNYIESLPMSTSPLVFGLHENASISQAQQETKSLFERLLIAERGGGGGHSDSTKDATIKSLIVEILSRLPNDFDLEVANLKYPVSWENSLNTVLCQELVRFNTLLTVIRDSLNQLANAVDGLLAMSSELESLSNDLFFGKVPMLWKKVSYPSLKPLSSYINDLLLRIKFFSGWLETSPPTVFWISAFFFVQAFLTGASQNYARKNHIPIDDILLEHHLLASNNTPNKPPENGVHVHGLYIEGARWDEEKHSLTESFPKVLFSLAPVIWFNPVKKNGICIETKYECPVYKTSNRRGVLSTTGHSTNFICFVKMNCNDVYKSHWVLRGVCMLTMLND